MEMIECIGGFADGKRFMGVPDGEMILFHSKNNVHREQVYIEHDGSWWQQQLFYRLDLMQHYDWSVNDEQ